MPVTRKPARQVQQDAGEEARLGRTGEQAKGVEPGRGAHEQQAGGQQAPADHHDRHPAPGANALQDQITGHPASEVTDEEDPRAQPVHGLAHAQIAQHLQLGEADVDPVQVIEQIADEQERDQPPQDLAVGGAHAIGGGRGRVAWVIARSSSRWASRPQCLGTGTIWGSTHSRVSVLTESSSGCCLCVRKCNPLFMQMSNLRKTHWHMSHQGKRHSGHAVGTEPAAHPTEHPSAALRRSLRPPGSMQHSGNPLARCPLCVLPLSNHHCRITALPLPHSRFPIRRRMNAPGPSRAADYRPQIPGICCSV